MTNFNAIALFVDPIHRREFSESPSVNPRTVIMKFMGFAAKITDIISQFTDF